MVRVTALVVGDGLVRLQNQDLPGDALQPGETPVAALARIAPDAQNPRHLANHHDGETLHLLYLLDGPGHLPLLEAYESGLSPIATFGLSFLLTGSNTISRPRAAAYGVLVQDAKILLCRLSAFEGSGKKWTLPGGGLEFGEHPEQAAVREVREETGLDIHVERLLDIQSEVHPAMAGPMHSLRFIYRAQVTGGTLTNELDGTTDLVEWHTQEEANRLPMVPLAQRGVELAFS